MKYLFIDTCPIVGGAEVYLERLCRFLKKRHQIYLILSSKIALKKEFEKIGKVKFFETGDPVEKWRGLNLFLPSHWNLVKKYENAIKSFKIDFDMLVSAGYYKDLFYTPHSNLPKNWISHAYPPGWIDRQPFRYFFQKNLTKYNRIITVSDFLAKYFQKYLQKSKITTIKNGIDVNLFQPPANHEKNISKEKLNFSTNSIILGNTSRIHKTKGQVRLVEVFTNLRKKYQNLKLLLVGDGSKSTKSRLKEAIDASSYKKDIKWLNFQKDIEKFYKVIDIFAQSSEFDNFPLTNLEAMASGIPVVAFKIGGIPEQIEDGKEGYLINLGNFTKFQKKLDILIKNENLRKKLGRNARLRIENEFNQNQVFEKVDKIFNNIAT